MSIKKTSISYAIFFYMRVQKLRNHRGRSVYVNIGLGGDMLAKSKTMRAIRRVCPRCFARRVSNCFGRVNMHIYVMGLVQLLFLLTSRVQTQNEHVFLLGKRVTQLELAILALDIALAVKADKNGGQTDGVLDSLFQVIAKLDLDKIQPHPKALLGQNAMQIDNFVVVAPMVRQKDVECILLLILLMLLLF